jgi:NAD(P)-dependent dehydrogenase (short-subunit alcohol dehydrogenase family)
MDPQDKLAVVTGAAGGIGGGVVRALLDAGAERVVAVDLRPPDGLASDRVESRRLDVTDDAATAALVHSIEADLGPIDLWFANAGIAGGGGIDAPDDVWDQQWRVNLMSHVYAARALFPGWTARGSGHLVTTASMAGILTSLGDGVYAAAKHAAVGLAEWLAITHAADGISVSCVCPGAVDTEMLRGGAGGDAGRATAAIGGGEVLSPDEAGRRIVAAVRDDRFLIFTHPEMQEYVERKAADADRWIRGMTRLWERSQQLLAD